MFIALAVKYLQVTPNGTIPASPPSSPFLGDSITVTAAGASGKITFTASAPDALGVVPNSFFSRSLPRIERPSQAGTVAKDSIM